MTAGPTGAPATSRQRRGPLGRWGLTANRCGRGVRAVAMSAGLVAACSTVLGLEDPELLSPDASVAGDASYDAATDQVVADQSAGDSAADVQVDAASDATQDSAPDADASGFDASADATADAFTDGAPGDGSTVGRVTQDIVVLYTFEEGSSTTVQDVSGNGVPLNLTIENPAMTQWQPGFLDITGNTIVASSGAATKVHDACKASDEISVEAWVTPANTTQGGPSRIFTFSEDPYVRNFTLGQEGNRYHMRLRTTATDANGEPATTSSTGSLTTSLTHVLYTRAKDGTARIYLNGSIRGSRTVSGTFSPWVNTQKLGLANEHTLNRTWLGELHLAAVYSRALTQAEASQNFAAGAD